MKEKNMVKIKERGWIHRIVSLLLVVTMMFGAVRMDALAATGTGNIYDGMTLGSLMEKCSPYYIEINETQDIVNAVISVVDAAYPGTLALHLNQCLSTSNWVINPSGGRDIAIINGTTARGANVTGNYIGMTTATFHASTAGCSYWGSSEFDCTVVLIVRDTNKYNACKQAEAELKALIANMDYDKYDTAVSAKKQELEAAIAAYASVGGTDYSKPVNLDTDVQSALDTFEEMLEETNGAIGDLNDYIDANGVTVDNYQTVQTLLNEAWAAAGNYSNNNGSLGYKGVDQLQNIQDLINSVANVQTNIDGAIKTRAKDELQEYYENILADNGLYPYSNLYNPTAAAMLDLLLDNWKNTINNASQSGSALEAAVNTGSNSLLEQAKAALDNVLADDAAARWKGENSVSIALDKITASNLDASAAAIATALDKYDELDPLAQGKVAAEQQALVNKEAAVEFYDTYKAILTRTMPILADDQSTITFVKTMFTAYSKLGENVKAYLDEPLAVYENVLASVNWQETHEDIRKKDFVTEDDLNSIRAALTAYDNLSGAKKAMVPVNERPNLAAKLNAAEFYAEHSDIIEKVSVTAADAAALDAMKDAFDNLENLDRSFLTPGLIEKQYVDAWAAIDWQNDNAAIREKAAPLTAADLSAIQQALDEYGLLTNDQMEMIPAEQIIDLNNKKEAAEFYNDHINVIEAATVTSADIPALENMLAAADALETENEDAADYLDMAAIRKQYDDAMASIGWQNESADIREKATVNALDLEVIKEALTNYNALSQDEQKLVPADQITDLQAKFAAADWGQDNNDILAKETITAEDLAGINAALNSYAALSELEKSMIDPATVKKLNDMKAGAEWAKAYEGQLSGIGNYADMQDAIAAYNDLTEEQKRQIDPDESLLNGLINTAANLAAETFINKYLKEADGSIIVMANAGNYAQILSGIPDWEKLTALEKLTVNAQLTSAAGKPLTYEELLTKANVVKDNVNKAEGFVEKYLKDEGDIITKATAGNYKQILSGLSDWRKMTKDEKAEVNAILTGAAGKKLTYDDLIAQANKLKDIDKAAESFVKKYLTDKDNGIITKADSDNYEQILNGLSDWEKMSREEKAKVNAILTEAAGKKLTYDDLIARANKLKNINKAADEFVKKHLTDTDGNIITTADDNNYSKIIGGLSDWEKLTEAEKEAVNAILSETAGKHLTYDDLLNAAKAIQASKTAKLATSRPKTGDDNNILFILFLLMASFGILIKVQMKKVKMKKHG